MLKADKMADCLGKVLKLLSPKAYLNQSGWLSLSSFVPANLVRPWPSLYCPQINILGVELGNALSKQAVINPQFDQ